MQLASPVWVIREVSSKSKTEPKMEAIIFYILISEMAYQHFCHILLITRTNPSLTWESVWIHKGVNIRRQESLGSSWKLVIQIFTPNENCASTHRQTGEKLLSTLKCPFSLLWPSRFLKLIGSSVRAFKHILLFLIQIYLVRNSHKAEIKGGLPLTTYIIIWIYIFPDHMEI